MNQHNSMLTLLNSTDIHCREIQLAGAVASENAFRLSVLTIFRLCSGGVKHFRWKLWSEAHCVAEKTATGVRDNSSSSSKETKSRKFWYFWSYLVQTFVLVWVKGECNFIRWDCRKLIKLGGAREFEINNHSFSQTSDDLGWNLCVN